MRVLREAYLERFKAIPTVADAKWLDEPWSPPDLKRLGVDRRGGVVLVAFLGMNKVGDGITGHPEADHLFAAAVVTNKRSAARDGLMSRGDQAALVAQRIAFELQTNDGVSEGCSYRPEKIQIRNVSGADTVDDGVAVFTVTWTQRAEIDALVVDGTFADLTQIDANVSAEGGTAIARAEFSQ